MTKEQIIALIEQMLQEWSHSRNGSSGEAYFRGASYALSRLLEVIKLKEAGE